MDACARGTAHRREDHQRRKVRRLPRRSLFGAGDGKQGKAILAGKRSLDDLSDYVLKKKIEPQPKSGKQEYLEGLMNDYL